MKVYYKEKNCFITDTEAQNWLVNYKKLVGGSPATYEKLRLVPKCESFSIVHTRFRSIPDGLLGISSSLKADESESFALAESVDGHFGGHDVAVPIEHHFEVVVVQMVVQVLDEQVVARRRHVRAFDRRNSTKDFG